MQTVSFFLNQCLIREDGYLFGMDNMIEIYDGIFEELSKEARSSSKMETADVTPSKLSDVNG